MTRKVALYLRVSTDGQDTARQERDLRAWAALRGFEVVTVRKEHASGGKADRKERAALVEGARRREFDLIAVTELSRWSRSVMDLLHTLQQLKSYDVGVTALNGPDFDFSTPMGKLMSTLLGAVSEFERELIRERTLSGLANARARGVQLGRKHGSNVQQDRFRSRVLELRANRLSIREIARALAISTGTVSAVLKAAKTTAT